MIVYLEPVAGTAKSNLGRAKVEMERVVGFRGTVTEARTERKRISATIEINPKWDLPDEQKVSLLKDWIEVKVRKFFKVVSISEK
jgi:hypothetical protein